MPKPQGRRDDETAEPAPRRRGPEKISLVVVIVLAAIGVVGLVLLAGQGG